ncbi:hypothetical protein K438DRAFT_1771685 [Mycena galopus ATCC 62051]|nr:hypothetical protein K438DRAFT_1771685 [Mycena galopus ATCC 62051]
MDSSSYNARFERSKTDDFLFSKSDALIIPTWSTFGEVAWLSFLALQYIDSVTPVLPSALTSEHFDEINCFSNPTWYRPQEHWLPWIPKVPSTLREDDPLSFLFTEPVSYEEVAEDLYGIDSEDSDPGEGLAHDIGYRVVPEWANSAVDMFGRLYCQHGSSVIAGDLPSLEEKQKPLWIHELQATNYRLAQSNARKVRAQRPRKREKDTSQRNAYLHAVVGAVRSWSLISLIVEGPFPRILDQCWR